VGNPRAGSNPVIRTMPSVLTAFEKFTASQTPNTPS